MATLEQTRHIELVSGTSQRFVVTSLMTGAVIPDQLPHLGVFVQRIITRGDPLDDTFQRVARIADLSELPVGRDDGLDSDPGVNIDYLSSTVILSYPTLDEAKAAATAVKDRVNALVTSWIDFKTNFEAPIITPIVFTFPSGGGTAEDLLISVYKVAKQDRYQKNLLKLESDAALARANTDYNYKRAREVELDAMVARGIIVETDMDGASSFHAALLAAGEVFLAAAGAAPAPDQATFQTALNVATNETSILASYVVDVSTLTGLINGYDAARVIEVAASSVALAAAQADQITKAQALLTAQATEATALAAVLAVCPDFDKNSIPMVDDIEP
jgi:hypothetical protein